MDGAGVVGGPDEPPVVEGFTVTDRLSAGAAWQVWRGRDIATGAAVVITLLYGRLGLIEHDRLRHLAEALEVLDHPHVLRLRALRGGGEVCLVAQLVASRSLADLVLRRGHLSAGEIVTIGTPLAQALAAAHARGLVHGAVTSGSVVITVEGRPVWADFGLACALTGDPSPRPADDIRGLGLVLRAALVGSREPEPAAADHAEWPGGLDAVIPRPLAAAITAACDPDRAARPGAAELAVMLYDAAVATPVRLGPPDAVVTGSASTSTMRPRVAPQRVARRRRRRTGSWLPQAQAVRAGTVAVATAMLLGVGGWRWLGPSVEASPEDSAPTRTASMTLAPPVAASSSTPVVPTDPGIVSGGVPGSAGAHVDAAGVLTRLDAKRSAAYATGDAGLLRSLYTSSSAAGRVDLSNLERMVAAGERARGFRTETTSVRVVARSTDAVQLDVVDTVPAFDIAGSDGSLVRTEPGRGEQTFRINLNRVDGRWLYATVEAVQTRDGT